MLKDMLIKFISSILLFIVVVFSVFYNSVPALVYFMIALCVCKFFIVMILEPDSIWEIIKKFIYLIISVILAFALIYKNKYGIIFSEVIIVLDTIIETRRFKKNLKIFNCKSKNIV